MSISKCFFPVDPKRQYQHIIIIRQHALFFLNWRILVGNERYGDNADAASIQEDSSFKEKLQNPADDQYFVEMIHALSLCHSVAIDDNKEFIGSSADELAIIKGLFNLNVGITRLSQDKIKFDAPFGSSEYRILRICLK